MGLAATFTGAIALWIVVWAIGVKAIDSFLIALVIMLIGVTVAMLSPAKQSNRE